MLHEWLDDFLVDAGLNCVLNALHDGLGVHLRAEIFYGRFDGRNGLLAFFLGCAAKLVGFFGVIRDIGIAGFNRFGEQADFPA